MTAIFMGRRGGGRYRRPRIRATGRNGRGLARGSCVCSAPMSRRALGVAFAAFAILPACTIARTIDRLQDRSPPPEFGRPGWVRTIAGVGAWTGGVLGGIASIVLLPVTYPVSLLAGDSFGEV